MILFFSTALGSVIQAQDSVAVGKAVRPVDWVEMINGDHLTGEITQLIRGELHFDSKQAGDVKIDTDDIRRLVGITKDFKVLIYRQGEFTGKIATSDTPGLFNLYRMTDTLTFRWNDLVSVVGLERKFWRRLNGNVNVGYSYTKSSEISRLNMSNRLSYISERWTFGENFSSIFTLGDSVGAERIELGLSVIYSVSEQWKLVQLFQFQRILELGVDSRLTNITGVGNVLLNTNHASWVIGTGLASQAEAAVGDTGSRDIQFEVPLFMDFDLFQLEKPDLNIASSLIYYYSLSIEGRHRLDFKIDINYEIIDDFTITVQSYYNFDSKPLSEVAGSTDYGLVLALGYSF